MSMQDARPESFTTAGKADALLNAMSVDIEDWFQVGAFETVIDRWNQGDIFHIGLGGGTLSGVDAADCGGRTRDCQSRLRSCAGVHADP